MREDGLGLEAQLLGVTKRDPRHPIPGIDQMVLVPAELVTTPVGQQSASWVKGINPALAKVLTTSQFQTHPFK